MKAKQPNQKPKQAGKNDSREQSVHKRSTTVPRAFGGSPVDRSKVTRAKRIRPLAPKQFIDIIEHMKDGLVVLDKDWHYVYVNQKAANAPAQRPPI
jgi:PAS domain-containing protein